MSTNNGEVFFDNIIQSAAVTGGNIDPDFPVDKVYNHNQGAVCLGLPGVEVVIKMVFPASTPIAGIVAFNHNLVSGDTFAFESSLNDFEDIEESINVNPKGYAALSWDFPYYRFRLQKAAGPVQVGEMYLPANYYQFERNFKYIRGYDDGLKFTEVKTKGPVYRTLKSERKVLPLEFEPIGKNQKDKLREITRHENVCFVPYPDKNEIFYGSFTFNPWDQEYIGYYSMDGYFQENAK